MADDPARIVHVYLDEKTVVRRSAPVEHERAAAIYDLLEDNRFDVIGEDGPFILHLSIEDDRLVFDVRSEADDPLDRFTLPTSPFRRLIKDYFTVCETYYDAIKHAGVNHIEAIDLGRRALHDEGSDLLAERLASRVRMDAPTARRLFTLVCVLHIRG